MNHGLLRVVALGVAVMTSDACAQQPTATERAVRASFGVAVYALSRGKGVPESAARMFAETEKLFGELQASGQIVRVHPVERIGIEGERRVCAELANEQAARAVQTQLLKMAEGAELVNVVIEPCVKS